MTVRKVNMPNYFLRYYDGHASTLYVCTVLMKLAQAKFRTAEDNHNNEN